MKKCSFLWLIIGIMPCVAIAQKKKTPAKPTPFTIEKLQSYLNTAAATDTDLTYASWSLVATDTKTKKVLASHNPNLSLAPASIQKVITTATALEMLGATKKFETQLAYTGNIKNGVLKGNLYLIGKGDPCFGSKQQDFLEKHYYPAKDSSFLEALVAKVKTLGITKIDGNIVADDSYFSPENVPETWAWGDLGNYYGAGTSGLCIYDNSYEMRFKTPDLAGANTQIIGINPPIAQLKITNKVVASNTSGDQTLIYNAPYSYTPLVVGELPKGSAGFGVKGSLPHPAQTAAEALKAALLAQGISSLAATNSQVFKEAGMGVLQKIYSYPSPDLAAIAQATNYKSVNLYAEMLLLHIGATDGKITTELSAETLKEFWGKKGITTKGLQMYDGSGLSRYNSANAKFFVDVLTYMKTSANYAAFYNSLPIGGQSGTVKTMFKGSICEGKIRLKSGSISKVRAYSGYLTTKSGREVAFAVMMNNYTCSDAVARQKLEKMMVKIAEITD